MNIIRTPLTFAQIVAMLAGKTSMTVLVPIDLHETLGIGLEGFNDLATEKIVKIDGYKITDLGYKLVAHEGEVMLEISGDYSELLDDYVHPIGEDVVIEKYLGYSGEGKAPFVDQYRICTPEGLVLSDGFDSKRGATVYALHSSWVIQK